MHTRTIGRREQGAALVVGMILLLVLTLLAVSGMNTASTELVMAGNEQFQENSFQAAETGIEQAMLNGVFNTHTPVEILDVDTPVPGTNDTYSTTIRPMPIPDWPMQGAPGSNLEKFASFHFEILSQGDSVRNATTTHTQGLYYFVQSDPGNPPPLAGAGGI